MYAPLFVWACYLPLLGDIVDGIPSTEDEEEESLFTSSVAPTIAHWESNFASAFSSTVFFQVIEVTVRSQTIGLDKLTDSEVPLVWVVRGETSLEQRGVVTCALPPLSRTFIAPHPAHSVPHFSYPTYPPHTRELLELLRPALYPLSRSLGLTFTVFVHGPPGCGKEMTLRDVADLLGTHLIEFNCYDIEHASSSPHAEDSLRKVLMDAYTCTPCILVLYNLYILDASRDRGQGQPKESKDVDLVGIMENLRQETKSNHHLILVGFADKPDQLSPSMRGWFRHEVEITPPDEDERNAILSKHLSLYGVQQGTVNLQHLAKHTVGFLPQDLQSLVNHAVLASKKRGLRENKEGKSSEVATITEDDLSHALAVMQAHHATTIGAPKIPNVKWEDVGGLGEAKQEIIDTIQLPLMYPWMFASGVTPRSGILLFGPPGIFPLHNLFLS